MTQPPSYGLIVEEIAHVGVYLVEKNEPLVNVVSLMDSKGISAVVVEDLDDLKHYYLISHADIIHFFAENRGSLDFLGVMAGGKELMQNTRAKDVMRGPVDIIPRDTPIDHVVRRMHERGFKRLIVGNEYNQPIGMVSTKDIISWSSDIFKKGAPILICVMENDSGLIIAHKFFKQIFTDDLVELLGGSLSAITQITSEVLKNSGDVRFIEKDYYDIMMERRENITAILVCDESSIELRRELQTFANRFIETYHEELKSWQRYAGSISVFKIRSLADIFQ